MKVKSPASGKLAEAAEDLVRWILDQALDGIGPLPSGSELAEQYRRQPHANDAGRVQGLIRWAVAKNAGTGFVTGLGGVLTLPVAIPGSLAASLAIQAPMVAAIAELYGHDSKDDRVRTAILLCMIGTAMEEVVKQAGETLGGKIAIEGLKMVPGKALIKINKGVGLRLLTNVAGQAADRAFRPTVAEHGLEARIDTAVATLEALIDARTTQLEIRLIVWMAGMVLLCAGVTLAALRLLS